MSNNTPKNVTPADVAAKAAEEKLVTTVPAQSDKASEPQQDVVEETTDQPELTVIEGDKKTLGSRLRSLTEKLKENKKVVIGVGAAVAVAALAFAKFAVTQDVEEDTVESDEDVTPEAEVETDADESAA